MKKTSLVRARIIATDSLTFVVQTSSSSDGGVRPRVIVVTAVDVWTSPG